MHNIESAKYSPAQIAHSRATRVADPDELAIAASYGGGVPEHYDAASHTYTYPDGVDFTNPEHIERAVRASRKHLKPDEPSTLTSTVFSFPRTDSATAHPTDRAPTATRAGDDPGNAAIREASERVVRGAASAAHEGMSRTDSVYADSHRLHFKFSAAEDYAPNRLVVPGLEAHLASLPDDRVTSSVEERPGPHPLYPAEGNLANAGKMIRINKYHHIDALMKRRPDGHSGEEG